MKFHHTLQFRISALLFLLGAVLIAVSHYRHLSRDDRQYREAMRTEAHAMGTRISGVAQHVYHRSEFSSADLEMSYAAVKPELVLGVVCDDEEIVRSSTLQQWRDTPLSESPLAYLLPLAQRVRETTTGQLVEDATRNRMVAIFPFSTHRNSKARGLVLLDFDLTGPLAAAHRAAINDTISLGLALLAACLFLWLALYGMITSRLSFVVRQTVVASADGVLLPPLKGKDEVAGLSRAFSIAFQRLNDKEQQFRQFAERMRDVLWIAPAVGHGTPIVNSAFKALWLLDPGLLRRKRWGWLKQVAHDDRPRVLHYLAGLRHEPAGAELEFRLTLSDGRTRWLQCRGFRLDSSADHGAGVGGIAVDVTERKEVARKLLEAAENERRRIGVDLHDDVCQRLAAARLKCGVLESLLREQQNKHTDLAHAMVAEISAATDTAKGYARGIAPVALNVGNFGPALGQMGRQIERTFGVKCTARSTVPEGAMDEQTATHVFRIAQELAVNAAKHGGGRWVAIRFSLLPAATPPQARLEVANDGVAFDGAASSEGMGLHLVKQRADVMDATVTYTPRREEDGGTVVTCDLPLRAHL